MNLEIDEDVKAVIEMMVATIPASRLVSVANGVQKIAPILWGRFQGEDVYPLSLTATPISRCGQHMPASSTLQSLDS